MNTAVPGTALSSTAPPWPVLQAPNHWRHIDFISDLHLQASEPDTLDAWQRYMQTTRADAVFILGDLFEVWVGDDVLDLNSLPLALTPSFETLCAQVLRGTSERLDLSFMHGNRDFLLGSAFVKACGMRLLHDPSILEFAGQRWLLSHGDALCLDDTEYMAFRAQVRNPAWQTHFLAQPLTERLATARALRASSESRKRSTVSYVDLDILETCAWLREAKASTLIHGHTHQPREHTLPAGLRRIVLSDWDGASQPPRAEVLRLSLTDTSDGQLDSVRVERLTPAQAA